MDVVFAHADRIIVLARGELIAEGNAATMRDNPKVQRGLLRQRQDVRSQRRGTHDERAMLEVQALNAWYGAAQILFDVSLRSRRGEVVALMGRNGAGKSTTMKALMGLMAQAPRHACASAASDISKLPAVSNRAAAGSASCPRTGASSPTSRCWRTSRSAASPRAAARTAGRAALDAGKAVRAVPQSRRDARPPRRPHERRRAADADRRAHADGQPVPGRCSTSRPKASRR